MLTLIRQKRYFVLHAPRQTGKTSTLLALRDLLNRGAAGPVRCVYANIEPAQAAREQLDPAMRAILAELARRSRHSAGPDSFPADWPSIVDEAGPATALQEALSRWGGADRRPLVLLLDEVDALVGDALISLLRQLRAGYDERPERFPASVVLCGVRDVRDYRIRSGSTREVIAGGSAFNIKAESLRLGDFSESDVHALLLQHTEDAGQRFTEAALAEVWNQSRGQPWLVNALAHQATWADRAARDRTREIRREGILAARERLILRRDTHLDQLADKLEEPRVRRVVEPMLLGAETAAGIPPDDFQYVADLGLIRLRPARIANPIYREVIPRQLSWTTEQMSFQSRSPAWYVDPEDRFR